MRNRPWTTGEVEKLRDMARRGVCSIAIARELGRGQRAVVCKARTIGERIVHSALFTADEDEYVRKHYGNVPLQEMADELGRSMTGIVCSIRRQKLEPLRRKWGRYADRIIRETVRLPAAVVAKRLKRSKHAVLRRRQELGVSAKKFSNEWKLRASISRRAYEDPGKPARCRWQQQLARTPGCDGWIDERLRVADRLNLTALWERQQAGHEWSSLADMGLDGKRHQFNRGRHLLGLGLVEKKRVGQHAVWRLAPGVMRLLASEAREIENPADLETEHERRIRMKIAEMEAAAKAGLLDDANPVAQQWDRDSRNTKRRRKVREWQLTKGAA